MQTSLTSETANNVVASKPDAFNQKPQSDSTSASFGDEAQKFVLDSNIYNKLNLKKNNKNNMELQNTNEDIFPKERQGGSYNYFSAELGMYGNIKINSKTNSNENTSQKNKEIVFNNDIPEMLLFKYNYDMAQYTESLNDIEYEVDWMYDFLNMGKCDKKLIDPNDVKKCLKNLLTFHKIKKYDIPYIICSCENIYKNFFRQDEVFDILSVYDVEFLRLQKQRKKILKFYEYIEKKNGEWGLGKDIEKYYLKKKYILEAKTSLELDLIEALLGILTYINQSNEFDENCKTMINVEILKNLNIDYSLLNKVKDDKLDEIIKQFCLYPEQVVHNIKVLNGEIKEQIIPPPFPGCPLNDLCKKAMVETAGKYASTKDILMTSFQYYNLILSLNPYIFNSIYKKLYDLYHLSTEPTEKGKEVLNSLHPSFHCKRINKMPIKYFFEEKNDSLCNIYTKNFGEIFLDIEKCSNNGLIKYTLNVEETPNEMQNLKNLLSKACNGLNDKMEIEENNSNNNPNEMILKKKYIGARNLCLDNLLIISKGFFLNIIKTKLHNYSEKSLIKKISKEFYNIISRNFLGQINLDRAYVFSIIYNREKNYFKLICLSPNLNVKQEKELYYVWKNDNIMDDDLELVLNSSEEQAQFHKLLTDYCPKAIVIDVSHLESYKMISFIRKFRDYNLIYSDYNSIIYKLKSHQMNPQQETTAAIEQVRYVINPVNQLMNLWRYKYEDNLLLNISLHPLQESIKDIPLLCYSLENQVIRVVNSKGIYIQELSNYSFNLFNFISGLGPATSSIMILNIRNYNEIGKTLSKKCPNIYNNLEKFMLENNVYKFDLYKLDRDNKETGLTKLDVFSAMIKDKIYFKKNCLCNAIVNNIDFINKIINCYLIRGECTIKALLRFDSVDSNIKNIKDYFYPQRIILCKIKEKILRHNSYEIYISNKNEDLITVKDFFSDQYGNSTLISEKYINIENDDFIIKDIENLKNIQKINNEKKDDQKKLKYNLISLENEQILRNVNYINMKKIYKMDYIVRPSFRGDDFLTLSFYLIDDIYLNYDIQVITRTEKNDDSNTTITEYKLGYNTYNSLTDLVNKFASKMKNSIENFRKNDYFKKPGEIRQLFSKILGIENPGNLNNYVEKNKNSMEIKIKKKSYENDNIKTNVMNVIILGFMKEQPDYGIILTKTNDELNYTIDFIKLLYNGYLFHGVVYTNLNEIIFFLKEKRKTPLYQNFVKSQFICTTHAQIEEIDEQYTDFDGVDPNLEKYNKSYFSSNDFNNLKNNLLPNENDLNKNNNTLLGKKRESGDFWNSEIVNKDNSNNNINNNAEGWGDSNENNEWNNDGGNKMDVENNWGDVQINEENGWGETSNENKNNNNNNNNASNWSNNNNDWADEKETNYNNNNEGSNNNWNKNKESNNNRFNNKKSFSNGSNNNRKFDKQKNNSGFNKGKKYNNNNNNNNYRNKGNKDWNNKERKNKESNFTWGNSNANNEQNNDEWNNSNNNNENKNASDNWLNNMNNEDYWGASNNSKNEWDINMNDNKKENKNETNNNNNNNKKDEKNNADKNDGWGGAQNEWGDAKDEWNANANDKKENTNKNNNEGNNNTNKNDGWNTNNNNNVNNKNKNDNWETDNTNNEWGTGNANNEWGTDNNNEWGTDNTNNNKNANTNSNNNGWGDFNNDDNNNSGKDPWGEAKENKNKNNNMSTFNNKNTDDSWADKPSKNNFSFNKGNKNNNNNNFHKNNSFNNNNNNNRRNFSHNNRNNNNRNNNFGNKNNNKGSFNSNWGNNNHNNYNNQNKMGGNKGKKNEKRWANELNKNDGETDIKQEDNGEVFDFENFEGFGGFDTKKEKEE